MISYRARWEELRERGLELLEESSKELSLEQEDILEEVFRDIVQKTLLYRDDTGDHYYYNSKAYAYEHVEDLKSLYSIDEVVWLREWQALFYVVCGEDKPKLVRSEISPRDALLYRALRGPIPRDLPEDCSYAVVIENVESAIRAARRKEKAEILSDYVKRHPELREELVNGRSIPKSYASELAPLDISVSDLVTYYNNTRRVPSLCGVYARRFLREYIERFDMLPENAYNCLESLGVGEIPELGGHITRLMGTLNREIRYRKARIWLKGQDGARQLSETRS